MMEPEVVLMTQTKPKNTFNYFKLKTITLDDHKI